MRYGQDEAKKPHAYQEDRHGEEIIRTISARAAEKHEIRRYRELAME
jgi:uncharacterized DUF497 family protein